MFVKRFIVDEFNYPGPCRLGKPFLDGRVSLILAANAAPEPAGQQTIRMN
jgi:hypothetical protein